MNLAKNIKQLRYIKNLSQDQLAADLGITRGRLGAYEEGRNEPPIELLIRLSEYFHIAIDALIKGDLEKTDPEALIKIGKNRLLFPVIIDKENNEQIEVVTMKASAGYLNGYADPEYMEKLPLMKLPFVVTGKHRAFPIKGDSMPPLTSGSYVVGKYVESFTQLEDGNTYVLVTKDEGIVYKRVYNYIRKNGTLELVSDNKSYQPYKVKAADVLEAWAFVCNLNLSDKQEDELNINSIMNMLKSMYVEIQQLKKES